MPVRRRAALGVRPRSRQHPGQRGHLALHKRTGARWSTPERGGGSCVAATRARRRGPSFLARSTWPRVGALTAQGENLKPAKHSPSSDHGANHSGDRQLWRPQVLGQVLPHARRPVKDPCPVADFENTSPNIVRRRQTPRPLRSRPRVMRPAGALTTTPMWAGTPNPNEQRGDAGGVGARGPQRRAGEWAAARLSSNRGGRQSVATRGDVGRQLWPRRRRWRRIETNHQGRPPFTGTHRRGKLSLSASARSCRAPPPCWRRRWNLPARPRS